ncbi:MAG: Rieske (2Fe-2S) protein [bacterium]|nr:Rieske (2Fe-2S) protein [bacterium]
MNRKEFIKLASASVVLTSLGISLAGCEDDATITPSLGPVEIDLSVSPFSDLNIEGGWLLHPSQNILLVNVSGSIRAFTSVCTHSGCARSWDFDDNEFICTCHNSKFNLSGNVVSGPASGRLAEYDVTRTGDVLRLT